MVIKLKILLNPDKEIVKEVRSAALDLADLKYEILKIVGDAYGNN